MLELFCDRRQLLWFSKDFKICLVKQKRKHENKMLSFQNLPCIKVTSVTKSSLEIRYGIFYALRFLRVDVLLI